MCAALQGKLCIHVNFPNYYAKDQKEKHKVHVAASYSFGFAGLGGLIIFEFILV